LKGGFDASEEGVADRCLSSLRFLLGGGFLVVVAVPFFLDGAERFFDVVAVCSGAGASVEGMGTDDSRSGDCTRRLCSFFSAATAFNVEASGSACCIEERRAWIGDDVCEVDTGSCLMAAGGEGSLASGAAGFDVFATEDDRGEGGFTSEFGSISLFFTPSSISTSLDKIEFSTIDEVGCRPRA